MMKDRKCSNLGGKSLEKRTIVYTSAKLDDACILRSHYLSWKWWHNYIVKMQQHGFVIKFQKKVWCWMTFFILYIWITWRRCVVCPRHMTADIFLYKFAIFAMQSIANIVFTNSYRRKVLSKSLEAEYESSKNFSWFLCEKTSENVLTSKICNTNPKKLHCKCIGLNHPLFPSDRGKFFIFFIFQSIVSSWGNQHDPSPPSCHLFSFYWN